MFLFSYLFFVDLVMIPVCNKIVSTSTNSAFKILLGRSTKEKKGLILKYTKDICTFDMAKDQPGLSTNSSCDFHRQNLKGPQNCFPAFCRIHILYLLAPSDFDLRHALERFAAECKVAGWESANPSLQPFSARKQWSEGLQVQVSWGLVHKWWRKWSLRLTDWCTISKIRALYWTCARGQSFQFTSRSSFQPPPMVMSSG